MLEPKRQSRRLCSERGRSRRKASSADFSSPTSGTLQNAINTKDTRSGYPDAFAWLCSLTDEGRQPTAASTVAYNKPDNQKTLIPKSSTPRWFVQRFQCEFNSFRPSDSSLQRSQSFKKKKTRGGGGVSTTGKQACGGVRRPCSLYQTVADIPHRH